MRGFLYGAGEAPGEAKGLVMGSQNQEDGRQSGEEWGVRVGQNLGVEVSQQWGSCSGWYIWGT